MKRDYKILIDRKSKLHNLLCSFWNKIDEPCIRKSSRDKRDKEAKELLDEAKDIIRDTIAKDFGWKLWEVKHERCTVGQMRMHDVTAYVQEYKDNLV